MASGENHDNASFTLADLKLNAQNLIKDHKATMKGYERAISSCDEENRDEQISRFLEKENGKYKNIILFSDRYLAAHVTN